MTRPKKKEKYSKISDIPVHIFSDRMLTEAVTPELREYLRYQLNRNENNLWYLYKRSQEYTDVPNSQYVMHFPRWLNKLRKALEKTEAQDNKDK